MSRRTERRKFAVDSAHLAAVSPNAETVDAEERHTEEAIEQRSSRLPGFYRRSVEERAAIVSRWADLSNDESVALDGGLDRSQADSMVENVVGRFSLPLGIATNVRVNGRDRLVPMAVEEPSVIAAASHGALLARQGGGFVAETDEPVMIGQIQILDLPGGDLIAAAAAVESVREEIVEVADAQSRSLPRLGGGTKEVKTRQFPDTPAGPMLIVHLHFDTRDAMGANAVNSACEAIAPIVERATGGRVLLRILSNLASERLARTRCLVPVSALGRDGLDGRDVARWIVEAGAFAEVDPWRAATHNKGIMNGVSPIAIATGNDWRGVEAGAHAWAASGGPYTSLSRWRLNEEGDLVGSLELPLALGIVGGGTQAHPTARTALKILDVGSGRELAEVAASVGLAQNLSALRALVSEGIQPGHMSLHARQVALAAGARSDQVEWLAERLVAEGEIKAERASEILTTGA